MCFQINVGSQDFWRLGRAVRSHFTTSANAEHCFLVKLQNCFADCETRSDFPSAWKWEDNDRIFHFFGWTHPLRYFLIRLPDIYLQCTQGFPKETAVASHPRSRIRSHLIISLVRNPAVFYASSPAASARAALFKSRTRCAFLSFLLTSF